MHGCLSAWTPTVYDPGYAISSGLLHVKAFLFCTDIGILQCLDLHIVPTAQRQSMVLQYLRVYAHKTSDAPFDNTIPTWRY